MGTVQHSSSDRNTFELRPSKYFSPAEQQRMIDEDLEAGRNVSLELFAIVTMGALLGALAVLLTI
jgi:hypothetical protein